MIWLRSRRAAGVIFDIINWREALGPRGQTHRHRWAVKVSQAMGRFKVEGSRLKGSGPASPMIDPMRGDGCQFKRGQAEKAPGAEAGRGCVEAIGLIAWLRPRTGALRCRVRATGRVQGREERAY